MSSGGISFAGEGSVRGEKWHRKWARRLMGMFPDISRESDAHQNTVGIVVSLALHLLLFLLIGLLKTGFLDGWVQQFMPERKVHEIEVVMEEAPQRVIVPLDEMQRRATVESEGMQDGKRQTDKAMFESDKNLVAGTSGGPKGLLPLPSQEGRSVPVRSFTEQEAAEIGRKNAEARKAAKAAGRAVDLKSDDLLGTLPEGPLEGTLVFRRMSGPDGVKQGGGDVLDGLSDLGGDRLKKDRSRVEGNLENTGQAGVDAVKSPVGVYRKKVSAAIGENWNALVAKRMDGLDQGAVKVRFKVDARGVVKGIEIDKNSANKAFADLCIEAVSTAKIPPPPAEALPLMKAGLLEIPFNFALY